MSVRRMKDWVIVVLGGIVLLAGLILLLSQWGNRAQFDLYWQEYPLNVFEGRYVGGASTAWVMVLSAIGGAIIGIAARYTIAGVMDLRRTRKPKAEGAPRDRNKSA